MRKEIYIFLLSFFIFISLAATVTVSTTIFQPAKPKSTVSYYGEDPTIFVDKYARSGYQVSSTAGSGNIFVVMVKY